MSFKKKKFISSREITISVGGQICIKKRFTLQAIYKYYRFLY